MNVSVNINSAFLDGLVFGFDVGTGSIGYAVRRGKNFLDVGVIICPEETSDLKKRRELRRQRRTLRSKKHRRQWLTQELAKLGLPRPSANLHDPVILRARAVSGVALRAEELHAAIAHLWRRRGYPRDFSAYCQAAWARFSEENPVVIAELQKVRKNNRPKYHVPESFTTRVCFAHFQQWRERVKAGDNAEFEWPITVRIPIRSVRLVSVKDDTAVARFSSGTHAYVKRTGFKEVRIHLALNGKGFVPVFVPYWKGDAPFQGEPIAPHSRPITVIRRGQVVKLTKPLAAGAKPGTYRVLVLGQNQVSILPDYLANKEEAKVTMGIPKTGIKPYWPEFVQALGYELPHSPSAQSESAGAVEA